MKTAQFPSEIKVHLDPAVKKRIKSIAQHHNMTSAAVCRALISYGISLGFGVIVNDPDTYLRTGPRELVAFVKSNHP